MVKVEEKQCATTQQNCSQLARARIYVECLKMLLILFHSEEVFLKEKVMDNLYLSRDILDVALGIKQI